jgi:hypothetical protein
LSIPITFGIAYGVVLAGAKIGLGLGFSLGAGDGENSVDWMGVVVAAAGVGTVLALALRCALTFIATPKIKQADDSSARTDAQVNFFKYRLTRIGYPLSFRNEVTELNRRARTGEAKDS